MTVSPATSTLIYTAKAAERYAKSRGAAVMDPALRDSHSARFRYHCESNLELLDTGVVDPEKPIAEVFTASRASPGMPRLSESPTATTCETASERSVMSSEVPVNGENPWWRRLSRSASASSSGSTCTAGVPSSMWPGSLSRAVMNGLLRVWEPARSARKAAVQWITGRPAALAAWSTEAAFHHVTPLARSHQVRKFR